MKRLLTALCILSVFAAAAAADSGVSFQTAFETTHFLMRIPDGWRVEQVEEQYEISRPDGKSCLLIDDMPLAEDLLSAEPYLLHYYFCKTLADEMPLSRDFGGEETTVGGREVYLAAFQFGSESEARQAAVVNAVFGSSDLLVCYYADASSVSEQDALDTVSAFFETVVPRSEQIYMSVLAGADLSGTDLSSLTPEQLISLLSTLKASALTVENEMLRRGLESGETACPPAESRNLSDGTYTVGRDIAPGQYRVTCPASDEEDMGRAIGSLDGLYGSEYGGLFSAMGGLLSYVGYMSVTVRNADGDVLRSLDMNVDDSADLMLNIGETVEVSSGRVRIDPR